MIRESRNPNDRNRPGTCRPAGWRLVFRASLFCRQSNVFIRDATAWALLGVAFSSAAAPFSQSLHSRSGQFIVSGVPILNASYASSTSKVSFVRLDPALVAISCEGIKKALLEELGLADQWRGIVTVLIHPVTDDNEPIDLTSVHYQNGWKYRLNIPEQVDGSRFIKAIVEVIIFEIANRKAGARQAELPPWLVTGLARHLQATSLSGLALEPRTALVGKRRNADALAPVRDCLRRNRALTIDQLNWPGEDLRNEDQNGVYESCAQLLVHDLLRLKSGRGCMIEMVNRLHQSLNWQTAFFQAFGKHFERLVDLDKWWSLRVVQFSQREPFAVFTADEQWRQLENILQTTTVAQANSTPVPVALSVSLQTVIVEWEPERALDLVREKISLLRALQTRANGSTGLLVSEYSQALEEYLQKRQHGSVRHGRSDAFLSNRHVFAQTTIRRLNDLDSQREELKKSSVPATGL